MKDIKKIAVLTSGGDAPGMNSAVRAVVFSAFHHNIEVVGIYRGYEGLIDWETKDLTLDDVRNINSQGGTFLLTSRSERFLETKYREQAAENLRANNVDALVAIGGDGTLRGAIDFKEQGVNVVCIPGTIDRDISCSEYTLGFDTAANTATEAIDKIRDSSISHGRCSVVEVMGRKRGYIALWAGMATSAEAIVLPEKWNGNNTVSIEISFFVISEFKLEMKDRYMYGNIDIFSHESKIKIVVDGSILCSFVAEAAVIQRMSAYIDTEI